MIIPHANEIREFQAPSTDKLLGRCQTQWHIILGATMKTITQDQREVRVPLIGETPEMVQEAIDILEKKDLGYQYTWKALGRSGDEDISVEDSWITGYLVFSW